MSEDHKILGVGPRCAEWLKRQYPRNRGKLVARDFDVHENTAWRWLKGVAPTTAHLEEMFSKWGRTWLEFVFVEAAERSDPRLSELEAVQKTIKEEIRAIEEEMRRLEARHAELATFEVSGWDDEPKFQRREANGEEKERSKFQRASLPVNPARIRRAELLDELVAQAQYDKENFYERHLVAIWYIVGFLLVLAFMFHSATREQLAITPTIKFIAIFVATAIGAAPAGLVAFLVFGLIGLVGSLTKCPSGDFASRANRLIGVAA